MQRERPVTIEARFIGTPEELAAYRAQILAFHQERGLECRFLCDADNLPLIAWTRELSTLAGPNGILPPTQNGKQMWSKTHGVLRTYGITRVGHLLYVSARELESLSRWGAGTNQVNQVLQMVDREMMSLNTMRLKLRECAIDNEVPASVRNAWIRKNYLLSGWYDNARQHPKTVARALEELDHHEGIYIGSLYRYYVASAEELYQRLVQLEPGNLFTPRANSP